MLDLTVFMIFVHDGEAGELALWGWSQLAQGIGMSMHLNPTMHCEHRWSEFKWLEALMAQTAVVSFLQTWVGWPNAWHFAHWDRVEAGTDARTVHIVLQRMTRRKQTVSRAACSAREITIELGSSLSRLTGQASHLGHWASIMPGITSSKDSVISSWMSSPVGETVGMLLMTDWLHRPLMRGVFGETPRSLRA